MREGALLVLAGRPNAGKSSLFNALLGDRAGAGHRGSRTTRDTIEATPTSWAGRCGWPTPPGSGSRVERVDRLGVEVSRRYLARPTWSCSARGGRALGPDERAILAERPTLLVAPRRTSRRAGPEGVTSPRSPARARGAAQRGGGAGLRRADRARGPGAHPHPRAPPGGAGSRPGGPGGQPGPIWAPPATRCSWRITRGEATSPWTSWWVWWTRGGAGTGLCGLLRGEVSQAVWIPRASSSAA